MLDILIQILEANIDYRTIIAVAVLYVLALWFLFSLWVYIDAKKRYSNSLTPILFFLVVFVLNFPGLIFYLIIRPEKDDEHILYIHGNEGSSVVSSSSSHGGINVPLINFVDESGNIDFSFQIKLNKSDSSAANSIKVGIDYDQADNRFQVAAPAPQQFRQESRQEVVVPGPVKIEQAAVQPESVISSTRKLAGGLKRSLFSFVNEIKTYSDVDDEDDIVEYKKEETLVTQSNPIDQPQEEKGTFFSKKDKKKNKKKKRKNR